LISTARSSLFARNVSGLWVAEAVILGAAFVQTIVVARVLGPKAFGTAALIVGTTGVVFTFLDPRSQEAVVKYLGAHHANGRYDQAAAVPKVAYTVDLVLAVLGFAFIALAAPWAQTHIIHSADATRLLIIFALAYTFTAPSTTSRAVLMTLGRFSTVALLQGGVAILRSALAIILVSVDLGVSGVVYAAGIAVVVESIFAAVLAHRAMRSELHRTWWGSSRKSLGGELRQILRFMAYTDVMSLIAGLAKEADVVLLGYLRGPTDVGFYRLASSVAAPMASLITPLQQVAYPRMARLAGVANAKGMQEAARRYALKVGLPVAGLALLVTPLLPIAVPAIVGSQYRPAIGAAVVLFVGGALTIPFFWGRPMVLAGGHLRFAFALGAVTTALTLAGYFVLGDAFGAVGVAAARASIGSVIANAGLAIYAIRKGPHIVGETGDVPPRAS
jgi:O-antigen/teichoic acid export membrane protein